MRAAATLLHHAKCATAACPWPERTMPVNVQSHPIMRSLPHPAELGLLHSIYAHPQPQSPHPLNMGGADARHPNRPLPLLPCRSGRLGRKPPPQPTTTCFPAAAAAAAAYSALSLSPCSCCVLRRREGPMVVHTCMVFQYVPLAPGGLLASTDSCRAAAQHSTAACEIMVAHMGCCLRRSLAV
jgi:hypothetical protein